MNKLRKALVVSQAEFKAAMNEKDLRPRNPWSFDAVHFDEKKNCMKLRMQQGVILEIPLHLIQELNAVDALFLKNIYLSPSGETLCLDEVDVYISTHGLIRDVFANVPSKLAASQLGSAGGRKTSLAKKISSAENGKKGGRPRKIQSLESLKNKIPHLENA